MDKKTIIQEKIQLLNKAAKAYYQNSTEIMSNLEYDKLYDELEQLEKETGIVLGNSPTQKVGYEILSDLPKEKHQSSMLSLDKTKDREVLRTWLGDQKGVLSWKLDGLTIVLTYEGGRLIKALTRGNGQVGEVITNNARVFANLPVVIPYKERLTLRGEAVVKYSDFEKINETISEVDGKYKNPRNLCSGSVRQLNNKVTAERNVHFFAFSLVDAGDVDFEGKRHGQLDWLRTQGFDVVEYRTVSSEDILSVIDEFENKISTNDFPSDGLVLLYDDIEYGSHLGATAKFPRDSIAFKWRDQLAETTLREIEWSASRTGLINPVAIFDAVELEGTTVARASVHNLSVMKELKLGIGDKITVYKANMIIPQIGENLTRSGNISIPKKCPVCGEHTRVSNAAGVETLVCPNERCLAKQIKSFGLFVSRDGMNMEGLSEATIEKLIAKGLIKELADLFHVEKYKEEITAMEGFGEKSFDRLAEAIERAKATTPERLLYALGIPNFGVSNGKLIAKACRNNWNEIIHLTFDKLVDIEGVGPIMAKAYVDYFNDDNNLKNIEDILSVIKLDETFEESGNLFDGMTFVITGSLYKFQNRQELKEKIESLGGKVAGSVSSKTTYLINNDLTSGSSKNKKATELGVKITDEETVSKWIETGAIS